MTTICQEDATVENLRKSNDQREISRTAAEDNAEDGRRGFVFVIRRK